MASQSILAILLSVLSLSGLYLSVSDKAAILQQGEDLDLQLWQQYLQWQVKYGKTTENGSEQLFRFNIFKESMATVLAHNESQSSYTLGMNQFADMTDEEFKDKILMKAQPQQKNLKQTILPNSQQNIQTHIKGNVNFQNKGVLNEVQNQGHCGSCYSFATAAALESAYKLQTTEPLHKFSEQQIVSCSQKYGNNGCNGGFGDGSFTYVIENGITTEQAFPYVSGTDAEVPACSVEHGEYSIRSYDHIVGLGHCVGIQTHAVNQPLYARVVADNWKLYQGGIFDNCSDDADSINHAVTIVGFNTESDNDDQNYWIVRNSWGPTWGEQGYVKLRYGNTCAICHDSYAPMV